ncbi:MAG: hypothetical protein CSA47_01270 [Gammaproteobacteria bacterium]|nr:MAG: hypothetical protein CSA47_01270 [Gammaproteobacteria bacterium]
MFAGLWLLIALFLTALTTVRVTTVQAKDAKSDIIYEYEIITQKKGQPFSKVLQQIELTSFQQKLVNEIPIYHAAKSDRALRFIFSREKDQRLLKEVKVTRGNRMINFVLVDKDGKLHFVSAPTRISANRLVKATTTKDKPTAKVKTIEANLAAKNSPITERHQPVKTAEPLSSPDKAPIDSDFLCETISQKKGQSFASALNGIRLTTYQRKLVDAIPVLKQAKSERQLRFVFAKSGTARLLKEVRFTRGKNVANYVLTGKAGRHSFVSRPSQIPEKLLKNCHVVAAKQPLRDNKKVPEYKRYEYDTIVQKKGESFAHVLKRLNLSALQYRLVNALPIIRRTNSNRTIRLIYAIDGKKRLLKEVRLTRGKKSANFVISNDKGHLRLVAGATRVAKKRLHKNKTYLGKSAITKSASIAKKTTNSVTTAAHRGFKVIKIVQKKRHSLARTLRKTPLSGLQRQLILQMPATKTAKSTRHLYALLEHGRLRALRVVRGKKVAEYILIKHKGQWCWADKKGSVSLPGRSVTRLSSSAGFSRYPLRFARVSSHFNLYRRHPITRRIRPHRGTDFAAPHGTPVYAPASGVVVFSGRQRGYGITLVIDHQNGYKTKYAHLSRIMRVARRKGSYVRKGQLIARVGSTGLSSGAHLHYEVIVNGRHRNPLRVRLPGGAGKTVAATASHKVLPHAQRLAKRYLPTLRTLSR